MISPTIQVALTQATERMRMFRGAAVRSREMRDKTGKGWELHPEEFWEDADEKALAALEEALHEASGEVPLPYHEEGIPV